MEEHNKLSESQAGFIFGRSCVDNLFVLNEVTQGRLQEGKKTFSFFLDIKKAYDTVWRDGLWYRMLEMGIQGELWHVIRNIYNVNQSCVYLYLRVLHRVVPYISNVVPDFCRWFNKGD